MKRNNNLTSIWKTKIRIANLKTTKNNLNTKTKMNN